MDSDLCYLDAVELAAMVRERKISCVELLQTHLGRIEALNPKLNAICTLVPEQAMETARQLDDELSKGNLRGPLHGLPIAIKDLVLTKGIRTTFGSPIYKDFVPDEDELFVQRLKAAGAVVVGKTNTPEFGAGSQTFNQVFGITRNPYNAALTCGGSSGGAAVALASGMLPIADGSDLAGSLRNPASWCNVIGFRPSAGRVPEWPTPLSRETLAVTGPMGRTVRDTALLLSCMAGPDARVPIALPDPGSDFLKPLERNFRGARIAWTPDLGCYPVEPAVVQVCEASLEGLRQLGCTVENDHPDLSGADEIFQIMRAWLFVTYSREDFLQHRDQFKQTLIWNNDKGLALTGADIARAEILRTGVYARTVAFFEKYDFLVLPAVQVAPFPVEIEYPTEINGVPLNTYIDWMAICYAISITGMPAISVPAGFTPAGLPIGLQIVGPPRGDFELLQMAHAFEQATGHGKTRPPL